VLSVVVLAALDYALVVALFTVLAAPVARLLELGRSGPGRAARARGRRGLREPVLVDQAVVGLSWGLPFLYPQRPAPSAPVALAGAGRGCRAPRCPAPWRVLLSLACRPVPGAFLELVAADQAVGLLASAHAGWLGQVGGKFAHASADAALGAAGLGQLGAAAGAGDAVAGLVVGAAHAHGGGHGAGAGRRRQLGHLARAAASEHSERRGPQATRPTCCW
jgi:hypothetical protein